MRLGGDPHLTLHRLRRFLTWCIDSQISELLILAAMPRRSHSDRRGRVFQDKIGEAVYDDVSLIQTGSGSRDHCTVEMIVRRHDLRFGLLLARA